MPSLYLATRLIVSVFPVMQQDPKKPFVTTADALAAVLRRQYGHGRVGEVQRALELLKTAGLVTKSTDDLWRILRSRPGLGRDNVHTSIATRVAKAGIPKPKRVKKEISGAVPLFDDADQLAALLEEQAQRG